MEYTISSPMRAFEALKNLYPDSSRRSLKQWLVAGRFTVDGIALYREDTPLLPGQILRSQQTFLPSPVPIVYADRFLIAIDKPAGLLSVPLDGGKGRSALGLLREYFQTDQIFAVHRIDRKTSGILLFARGSQAASRLHDLFECHALERQYFAIVEGRMQETCGSWKSRLLELPSYTVIESSSGQDAATHFEVLRRSAKYSYLKLSLETGRKHQIRVHCQSAGHPVLGDKRYGSRENPIRRLCLHAISLKLVHPFTKKQLSLFSQLPRSFKALGGSTGG